MKESINKKDIIIFILTLISSILSIIGSSSFFDISENKIFLYAILRILSFIIIGAFWSFIINIIINVKKKDKKTLSFLKYFLFYFVIMFIFLLLTWPGIFKGDEFYVLINTIILNIQYMQHYITNIFYAICIMIFPAMATITFVQLLIICCIVGYMGMRLEESLSNKKITWLFFIPLLFLPVIDNNLFPLRNSIITYLFLLLIFEIWRLSKSNEIKKSDYIKLIILVSFIGALKTEYLYLAIVIPIVMKYIFKIGWKKTAVTFLAIIITTKIINIPQKDPNNNTYILTAIINPLSTIVSNENVKISKEDIEKINAVVDYEKLKEEASFVNIPIYFSDYMNRKIDSKEKIDFLITYVKLVINHMDLFLENRCNTFLYTSGMKKDYINHTGHEDYNYVLKLDYNKGFMANYMKYSNPIFSQEIREKTIKLIACRDLNDYQKTNPLYPICYNVLPQIIILIVAFVYAIIRKKKTCIAIIGICLPQFFIVFLTAPAAFWMYYMPFYMSANMIIMYLIIKGIETIKRRKNYEHSNNNGRTRKEV